MCTNNCSLYIEFTNQINLSGNNNNNNGDSDSSSSSVDHDGTQNHVICGL